MKKLMVMFVYNEPALFVGDYLVIADLHIGISREMAKAGVSLPSQIAGLSAKLNGLKKQTNTKNLLVAGDFKHSIPWISYAEQREVPEILRRLDFEKIIITKGNHDGRIETLIDDNERIMVRKSFSVDDYIFTHGHRNIATNKGTIVIGHNHPGIKFRDRFGAIYVEPAWILGKVELEKTHDLIIMPAFNELSGKGPVNETKQFMGPIARHIRDARAVLLDGTDLGPIRDLAMK
ncbi:MAG: metallophosphoesterase [Candidatus Aenigmarchaeota archaeon]|nr:metallophosphoesterase [Candidatus Aenigmarchaeota archaeon]